MDADAAGTTAQLKFNGRQKKKGGGCKISSAIAKQDGKRDGAVKLISAQGG